MEEITKRITKEQKFALIQYMEEHEEFANDRFVNSTRAKNLSEQWDDLAEMLNASGGACKGGEMWRRAWVNMRSKTKQKCQGPQKNKLTDLDERLLAVISKRGAGLEPDLLILPDSDYLEPGPSCSAKTAIQKVNKVRKRRNDSDAAIFQGEMSSMECFLCLDIKRDIKNCIKIGSTKWNEEHIESVIEKHLWPLAFQKSKSRWLCTTCWQMLHDFHAFYKRMKNANERYEFMVKSEDNVNKLKLEDDDVSDVSLDSSQGEVINEPIDDNNADFSYDDECENHIFEQKHATDIENVVPEILCDGQLSKTARNYEEKNPLELTTPVEESTTKTRNTKFYIAKVFQFTCDICQEQCKSFGLLRRHFRQAHDQEVYVICCYTKFVSRILLGEHIQSHLNSDSVTCKYCFKIFKNKRNLAYHMARWHEGSVFNCKLCNKRFTEQAKFLDHVEEHEDMFTESFYTSERSGSEKDEDEKTVCASLESDNKEHSQILEKYYKSNTDKSNLSKMSEADNEDISLVPISNNDETDEHLKEEIDEIPTTVMAEKAENTADSPHDLELSIPGYLLENLKFHCDICHEPCESFGELKQHFFKDHNGQRAYVVCCGEKIRNRQCLGEHVKTHLYPGCFQCPYCKQVLKNKRNFRAHIRRWHTEKTFQCEICNNRFLTQEECKEHKLLHEIPEDGEKDKSLDKSGESKIDLKENENDDGVVPDEVAVAMYKNSQSRIRPTPEELLEFDEFLSKHFKFTCSLCNKPDETYENFTKLRQHFAANHKVEGFVLCCRNKFIRRRNLVEHVKGHLDPDYLKCIYCFRKLRDKRSFSNHMAFHERNVQQCKVCKKRFYDPILYENHKCTYVCENSEADFNCNNDSDDDMPLIHSVGKRKELTTTTDIESTMEMDLFDDTESSTEANYKSQERNKACHDPSKNYQRQMEHDAFIAKHFKLVCPVCEEQQENVQFQTFALLRDHFAMEHNDEAYVVCCSYKYKKRDTLYHHIKTHLNPEDFKCEFCSKVLKTKRNLEYHIRARHEGKIFRCDLCCKKFVEENSLIRHRKKHRPNENTNFPCPECGRCYKVKNKLTHHINTTHRMKYARLCDICGGYFRDINLFNAHMKTKHAEESAKEKFPCKICGRILSARSSYRLHMKTQHPENESYSFTCPVCSKQIATRGLLNYHIRMSHKSTRQHKCNVCGKSYKELKQLRGHMGIHTGESLFKCNFCPKAFNSTGNRSSHRKKFHAKEWAEFQKKLYIQNKS